jgi:hypothetical protein
MARKTSSGGGGGGGAANLKTIILGVIAIVVGLIMLGIAMDTVSPMLTGGASAVNWTKYPGGESIIKLFPLLMMISLVLFGGVLIWIGYKGSQMDVKSTILTTVVVIVAVILLPLVITQTDALLARADLSSYTGLSSFLGLVPLLYVLGITFITGMVGFRAVRSKV